MLQERNTLIVLAIVVSHLNLVSTTSCFCTPRDSLFPVFSENNKNEAKTMVFIRKKCFTGRTEGSLFCPDSQSFCLNKEGLYSTPCGEAFKSYSLTNISSQFSSVSHRKPEGAYTYHENLFQRRFLVDRHWGMWGLWQECTTDSCGKYGIQARERQCLPKIGDLGKCPGDAVELNQCLKNCSQPTVSAAIGWTKWSTWSSCDTSCMSSRTRVCQDVSTCVGNAVEQKTCAVDGMWSNWGTWTRCTNDNFTHRIRTCDNPLPACGGKQCDGNTWYISTCTKEVGWTAWTDWSSCINTEGFYFKLRNRTCKGDVCDGKELDYKSCQKAIYTAWSYWGQCSVTCGNGVRTRDRLCIDANSLRTINESFCNGDSVTQDICFDQMCQDSSSSVWSDWSAWSNCDPPCDTGISTRTRTCLDTKGCHGLAVEKTICSLDLCNIDGGWTAWEEWSQCSQFQYYNIIVRYRHCTNPYPKNSGKDCMGDEYAVDTCKDESSWGAWVEFGHCYKQGVDGNTTGLQFRNRTCHVGLGNAICHGHNEVWQPCTLQGVWSRWGNWSACSETCDIGVQQRHRYCIDAIDLGCAGSGIENQTCHEIKNCPVDGKFSEWSAWSDCPVTCDWGPRSRNRYCNNPKPQFGGKSCSGSLTEAGVCNTQSCPVDGKFSEWSAWSDCPVTCDWGPRSRNRYCNNPIPQFGGKLCTGPLTEAGVCNTQPCPVDGYWTDWGHWKTCSVSCGNGTKTRDRTCTNPQPSFGGKNCDGHSTDSDSCMEALCSVDGGWGLWEAWTQCTCQNSHVRKRICDSPTPVANGALCVGEGTQTSSCTTLDSSLPCPVNGGWTDWSQWGTVCSVTCGHGTVTRKRECSNPTPTYGGASCVGEGSEGRECISTSCPVDGGWSDWSVWFGCSTTCGPGINTRYRACNNPVPKYHGQQCRADFKETITCNVHCPVIGGWTDWSQWGTVCSVTCGHGTVTRKRECSNPSPAYGGASCVGEGSEGRECSSIECPVDGAWSSWSAWSHCGVTCANGTQSRNRTCNKPEPAHGGRDCKGIMADTMDCAMKPCPIDGVWSDWQAWSNWDVTCARGSRSRARKCDNPAPMFGGHNCPGDVNNFESKELVKCPVDGGWSDWSGWFGCSTTCGPGLNTRYRACNNPVPKNHGQQCAGGDFKETVTCNKVHCPVDGNWGSWLAWESCSASCGDGIKLRHRQCDNPAPQYGGANCTGINKDSDTCNKGPCPIDGMWGTWQPWSYCFGGCTTGMKQRYRNCDHPKSLYGGAFCTGPPFESASCIPNNCTVNGNWGSWMAWEGCSTSCGDGIKLRHRPCGYPTPQYGGANCTGINEESDTCNKGPCPTDGLWGSWLPWRDCIGDCTAGTKERFRNCDSPITLHGGVFCSGAPLETTSCLPQNCTVDGNWGSWLAWESCSASCGDGIKLRHRQCDNPAPQYGGANCTGIKRESETCNQGPCPIDGMWGTWQPWSYCIGGCTTGMKQRFRNCDHPRPLDGGSFCTGSPFESASCIPNNCTEFKCYVCDTTMPEFCVALKREETCHQPYCINEFTNNADGTKQLSRRCGTKTECDRDWWKSTSNNDKCTMFDVSQTVTNYIHCTFCCVDELCNEHIIPPHKSLYTPPTL